MSPVNNMCPLGTRPHVITTGLTLYMLAGTYKTTVKEILDVNPGVNPYDLKVGQVICVPVKCERGFYYQVKHGDTLYKIAQKYNVTIKEILAYNPRLGNRDYIIVGESLCIPHEEPPCEDGFIYTIQEDDEFITILEKFNISYKEFIEANPDFYPMYRLFQLIYPGNKICIMAEKAYDSCSSDTYVIREGENLETISKKLGISRETLLTSNPNLSPAGFVQGTRICAFRQV